jgi:hypothetical protein
MFDVDIEYNSSHFYVSKDIIHVFGVTGKNRITFLLSTLNPTPLPVLDPVPGPTLRPTLRLAQKRWMIWRLWYWRKWWANQEHGFFSCFPPLATELLTTQFKLLSRAIIGSLYFVS